ncbi:MAG TPA: NAD(P)H-binding protein [Actinophytocola sp.]|nr:NAD(P)H-binding protein [Actinophytocola sp.]
MILLTGGTGTLGRAVAARLPSARVLSRRPGPGRVVGDLSTGAGLADALSGVDTVIHCATSLRARDVEHARHLIAAAAGRPHVVYVSIVGVDEIPLGYYRTKLAVERLLASSGLPWTVLRATQFHDLVLRFFTVQRWSPALFVPSGAGFQPIDVRDVADRLVSLASQSPAGRVADIGGPEVRPVTDLARSYLSGRRRPVVPIPLPGKVMRGFRTGANLAPATGTITFEEFLRSGPV